MSGFEHFKDQAVDAGITHLQEKKPYRLIFTLPNGKWDAAEAVNPSAEGLLNAINRHLGTSDCGLGSILSDIFKRAAEAHGYRAEVGPGATPTDPRKGPYHVATLDLCS